ncbi:AraC family transcriptional regulator [Larkinella insperata]|uniref:AraC family transcriptional regulator n=1 Tax=Larkinella insperata TaxID=332158 RepID=A0ABW3QK32_9BACT|nr:AraC family transcriptional regulator [Larkinella insperata]
MATNNTLSAGSFNLVLFAAQQKGADVTALCRAVGVDPAVLRNPDGRIPIRTVQALWREVIAVTNDPYLSLRIGEMINPTAVGVLAYVMMHCPTLGEALEKLCQYQAIVCEGVKTVGQREGDRFRFSLHITCDDIIYPEHALNSELVMYLAAMRALTGHHLTPTAVSFAYPRPIDTTEHERVFAPVKPVFDAEETALALDVAWLDAPVLNANPGLFPLFEQHAAELLRKLQEQALVGRVKGEIVALLKGEEPTLATVADRLAMGVRTLQLHLKEEGVTYQQLLDEVRHDLAVRHLREPHFSTTDIAYLLGFSEPSVFYRTFKKWTGSTPGAYRTEVLRQSA